MTPSLAKHHNQRLAELADILPEETSASEDGVLEIGGVRVDELAETYGTPLHIMDEVGLRRQMRRFSDGLKNRWPNSEVLFASKSLPTIASYAIAAAEGLSIDVAGGGELKLALAAGVDPKIIHMHGNAKTDEEIQMALEAGIGTIIIDNFDEIARLEVLVNRELSVLVRVIPGIDARTHASQATGGNESKFGLPIEQAREAIERLAAHPLITCEGVHLHIGSQILEAEPFGEAVAKVAPIGDFATYDVGGGLGVKYTYSEHPASVDEYLDSVVAAAKKYLPAEARLMIEPGRSVVARAGCTLYEVQTVKHTAAA